MNPSSPIVQNKPRKSWLKRLALSIDQFVNVLLFNGDEDHTISGRTGYYYKYSPNLFWRALRGLVNALFFWQQDHCDESIEFKEVYVTTRKENLINAFRLLAFVLAIGYWMS